MARVARGEYLDPQTIQIVHAVHRCVRRAFLCGRDPVSGRDFDHRRDWIRDRLEFLASVFAIDCLTFSLMSNHIHLVLRSRPDVARQWSDEEVARRWLRLYPKRRDRKGQPCEPSETELNMILLDPTRLAQLRTRLSDISWWMRCTAENIARRANKEDQVSGHFWESRFKAGVLNDEASLLACAMYVDLNPVRAAIAATPEESTFTGARERIDDLNQRQSERQPCESKEAASTSSPSSPSRILPKRRHANRRREREQSPQRSGWMSPIEINELSDPIGADASDDRRRASLKGFLSMTLERYLELLDWTGRQLSSGKPGAIPAHLAPILLRLGIDTAGSGGWLGLVEKFGRMFRRATRPTATEKKLLADL